MIYNVYTLIIMKTTIAKWGNSLAVRIPSKALERLNLKIGENFSVDIENDKLILSPTKVNYQVIPLSKLLKGMKRQKLLWPNDKPRGKEIW